MPEFIAVNCFNCHMFQVQQVRKDKKWSCKTCGSKQSVIKVYAADSKAALVRPIVQSLNMKRGTLEEELKSMPQPQTSYDDDHDNEDDYLGSSSSYASHVHLQAEAQNKWGKYMDDNDKEESSSSDRASRNDQSSDVDDSIQVMTVVPDDMFKNKTRKRKRLVGESRDQDESRSNRYGRKRTNHHYSNEESVDADEYHVNEYNDAPTYNKRAKRAVPSNTASNYQDEEEDRERTRQGRNIKQSSRRSNYEEPIADETNHSSRNRVNARSNTPTVNRNTSNRSETNNTSSSSSGGRWAQYLVQNNDSHASDNDDDQHVFTTYD